MNFQAHCSWIEYVQCNISGVHCVAVQLPVRAQYFIVQYHYQPTGHLDTGPILPARKKKKNFLLPPPASVLEAA
ncbi:hypothetical protein PGT21_031040 [Puccinia graminis f. sp. tritici]|uniref:Uncharacterized protein n=1 Tax=Puccinia graminis f. sp. tritici TaxID=56615 RepID=A0A5B0NZZ7_PUCGR|nr:hypothetical protein PGT21_031040 [Puccinia graminis f. sp. tritici]